jgi:LPXTG-site transpeptidase (sortase) family protein
MVGSVVVDGHVDNARGKPGVFYNLKNLVIGDAVVVTNASGTAYTYRVTASNVYNVKNFPSREVFGTTTRAKLELITCDGAWIQSQKTYDKRLVVTAELVQ